MSKIRRGGMKYQYKKTKPHSVIDLLIPDGGLATLRKKELSLWDFIYSIIENSPVIAHHGVLDEGVNFIQKSFSLGDLSDKVREALEG